MEPAVSAQELTRTFGSFTAVDRLSLSIAKGEICAFLGPNGAGKSTAIRMLCGILTPTSGSAQVLGYDLVTETEEIKQRIGYMSQRFSLYNDLTVLENLEFYAGLYGIANNLRKKRVHEMLAMAQLLDRRNELAGNLSGGWKQRLALGCAVISRPSVVFLDEPTSGVSPTSRRAFFNIIHELANTGTTVIVTTHFMDEAERCHRIAFMSQGKLLAFASPWFLKHNTLQGYLVEVLIDKPMEWIREIEQLEYVREITIHGALIHVLLDHENNTQRLEKMLGVQAQPITPSLEDVFIALAKQQRREVS
ncbi:MAG: ABC transporter ATP-binding protein [Syntrophomonadaceae bacterium]|nr:ABC transporter ATP-binding protein [Syntrophomonadaceae bacterium]